MKRILFALLLLPQLAFSQYRADCFSLDLSDNVSQTKIGNTFDKDTTLNISVRTTISGLSISGTAVLDNDNDSYIRVTLVDNYNYEFLVYENYPALSDDLTTKFSNIALETILLDDITPQYLKISMLNASLKLDSINYSNTLANNRQNSNNSVAIQKAQTQYIVDKLNTNLERRNKTWRAGITSMSGKSYSEKKEIFGDSVPVLYGFEHYTGGIFVIPGDYLYSPSKSSSSSQYVSEWDWRDRHGKNWMTSVKNQGNCQSCWIFSAVGSLEAYINLYYNQYASYINSNNELVIGYNLSEQELMNCIADNNCSKRGSPAKALKYIMNNGVVNEECFRYEAEDKDCSLKCSPPAERVYIENYESIHNDSSNEYVKEKLFRAPLPFSIRSWKHCMVLVGYKTLAAGDVIRTGTGNSTITISETFHSDLIGKTAWLFKNSWGANWGEENGYAYAVVNTGNRYMTKALVGNVTCMQHTDNDIVCEDADGDGYYFWGVSDNKPSYCPSWVPDIKDGNDDNSSKGKLLLENTPIIGELETLNPDGNSTIVISGNITYTTRQSKYSHIRITSGGKLTVKNILNLFGRVTVTIESGGELVIDGGVVTNAYLSMASGGKLTLQNGGKLVMRTNTDLVFPTGALSDILHGEILRSNDY